MRRFSATLIAGAAAFLTVLATIAAAPSASAAAAGQPLNVCPGFSGYNNTNAYTAVEAGYVSLLGHTTKLVNPSTGATAWTANPYKNASWQTWLHSLKWVGDLIYTASGRHANLTTAQRQAALDLAVKIVADYRAKNPAALTTRSAIWQKNSSGHRAQVLGCLVESLGSRAPSWLVSYANTQAAWLTSGKNYLGAWNQGLDQDLGAIAITCITGYTAVRDSVVRRATATMETNIDAQGATSEQSVGYGAYGYSLWTKVITSMDACGITPPAISSRVALVPDFLAWASTPSGHLEQLGDTTYDPTPAVAMTAVQSAAALGASANVVRIYDTAGYVFGRSSWSNLSSSMYYTLRFGPAMALHGHADKTSVTYWVRGQQILTDSGHIGYNDLAARIYLRSTAAHNSVSTPARTYLRETHGAAYLVSKWSTSAGEGYTVNDTSLGLQIGTTWKPYTKTRSVVVLRNPNVMIVLDNIAGGAKGQAWNQRWHFAPGVKRVSGSSTRATFSNGASILSVPVATSPAAKTTVASSWIARTTGVKTADLQAVVSTSGRHAQFLTIVAPTGGISYRYNAAAGQLTVTNYGQTIAVLQINANGSLTQVG